MLILRSRKGERIIIRTPDGRRIVVTLTESRDAFSRLGFEADADVLIDREKVLASKLAQAVLP